MIFSLVYTNCTAEKSPTERSLPILLILIKMKIQMFYFKVYLCDNELILNALKF